MQYVDMSCVPGVAGSSRMICAVVTLRWLVGVLVGYGVWAVADATVPPNRALLSTMSTIVASVAGEGVAGSATGGTPLSSPAGAVAEAGVATSPPPTTTIAATIPANARRDTDRLCTWFPPLTRTPSDASPLLCPHSGQSGVPVLPDAVGCVRSEEHTSELQSLMRHP